MIETENQESIERLRLSGHYHHKPELPDYQNRLSCVIYYNPIQFTPKYFITESCKHTCT